MLPMAVLGAQIVDSADLPKEMSNWTWVPECDDDTRASYSVHSARTTSRMTNSKQMDHGTQY